MSCNLPQTPHWAVYFQEFRCFAMWSSESPAYLYTAIELHDEIWFVHRWRALQTFTWLGSNRSVCVHQAPPCGGCGQSYI